MTPASLTEVARRFLFVRETLGPNLGAFVQKFQREAGGIPGESWCADFLSYVLDVAYFGASPLPRTGSCGYMFNVAKAKGWLAFDGGPKVDDVYFFLNSAGVPHHVGIVTASLPLTGIAGNTSEDGKSVNGTGVFEHELAVPLSFVRFARLPRA